MGMVVLIPSGYIILDFKILKTSFLCTSQHFFSFTLRDTLFPCINGLDYVNSCKAAKSSYVAASDTNLTPRFPVTSHDQVIVVIHLSHSDQCLFQEF